MNQDKLETLKQEKECISIAVLGVSELKWSGKRYFQSDNYKVFYTGGDKLRRNEMTLIWRQEVALDFRGYNVRPDQMMSIRFQRNPINIIIIWVYAPLPDAEENDTESFYASIQDEIDHTPKQDMLIIISDWNAKIGNKVETNVWTFGLRGQKQSRRIAQCFAKLTNYLLKIYEHHQMANTENR